MRPLFLGFVELPDQILLFGREGLGEDDIDLHVLVPCLAAWKGDTHGGHLQDCRGLGAGGDVEIDLALDGLDGDRRSEKGIGEGDVERRVDVGALSFVMLGLAVLDDEEPGAGGTAVDSGIALSGNPDHVVVVDALGDVDGDGLIDPDAALAMTVRAFVLDLLSSAAAVGADTFGLHHAEDGLASCADTAGAAASRTIDDILLGLGACPMTIRAGLDVVERNVDLRAVDGLVEGELDGDAPVGAFPGNVAPSCPASSAAEELTPYLYCIPLEFIATYLSLKLGKSMRMRMDDFLKEVNFRQIFDSAIEQ